MTSSARYQKRFEEATKYGLWQFGGNLDHYIKVNGECHPNFISIPLGSPTGPKICMKDPRVDAQVLASRSQAAMPVKFGTKTTGSLYDEEDNKYASQSMWAKKDGWSKELKAAASRKQMYDPYINRFPEGREYDIKELGVFRVEVPYDGIGDQPATDIGVRAYPIYLGPPQNPDYTRFHGPSMKFPELAERKIDVFTTPDALLYRNPELMRMSMKRCGDSAMTYVRE